MSDNVFQTLNLSEEVQRAIEKVGYTEPTDIQKYGIPPLMEGRDVIGRSRTGTGKTAAFAIPAIEKITDLGERHQEQVLLMCPTRELAMQACDEVQKLARFKKEVRAVAVYGGAPMDRQIQQLRRGANFIVGTPGRVQDHLRRRTLKLDTLHTVILDEADEMLKMGFREEIETILAEAPAERQTVLFSATMPQAIQEITKKYLNDPVTIEIESEQDTLETTEQVFYDVPQRTKKNVLHLSILFHKPKRAIVFCNTKSMVDELVEYLCDLKLPAVGLHGDMQQRQRTAVMESFKRGRTPLLIATDVAARGIDVNDLDVVYNFDLPQNTEQYIHRVGRTGRAGKTGRAFTIVANRQQKQSMFQIARESRSEIPRVPVPTPEDIQRAEMKEMHLKIVKQLEEPPELLYRELVSDLVEEGNDLEDIAATVLAMLLEGKKVAPVPIPEKREKRPHTDRFLGDVGRAVLSVGRNHKILPGHIVGSIASAADIPGTDIGKIKFFDRTTVVDVPKDKLDAVVQAVDGMKISGYTVRCRPYVEEGEEAFSEKGPRRDRKPYHKGGNSGKDYRRLNRKPKRRT